MDTHTVKARLFAADDERGKVRQGTADRNSERDTDASHFGDFPYFRELISQHLLSAANL